MTDNKKYPPVVVVDENDREVGAAPLAEVWRKGLYHRIVSVLILDERGRMLLQRRGPDVKIYPDRWDQAAAGHVDVGQSYDQAAEAELAEELGVRGVHLKVLGTLRSHAVLDGRIINQFEQVYQARLPSTTPLQLERDEVSAAQWFAPDELRLRIADRPETFTPGLVQALRAYYPDYVIGS